MTWNPKIVSNKLIVYFFSILKSLWNIIIYYYFYIKVVFIQFNKGYNILLKL